jgi:8-oxo-dGTP pyrophosphatase MutT (NUDIX family)
MKKTNETKANMRFKYRVAAVALQDSCVLIHQFEGSQYWSLPGGNVEMGETSQEALKRELQEEAELTFRIERLLWVHENLFERADGRQVHELAIYYLIELNESLDNSMDGWEDDLRLHFRWVPLDQLSEHNLVPPFLKQALLSLPETPVHLITVEDRQVG